jgi:hypothetical protein
VPGGWHSLPVDCAAKITALTVFNDNASLGLYSVMGSSPLTSDDLVKVTSESGLKLKIIDVEEFKERMMSDDNPLITIFREGMGDRDPSVMLAGVNPVFKHAMTEKGNISRLSRKLFDIIPNVHTMIPHVSETLKLMFKFAKDEGIFGKVNIEYVY